MISSAKSLILLVAFLAVVYGTALNPTEGEQECCNAAKLQEMKAVQIAQQKMIQELTIKLSTMQAEMITMNAEKKCPIGWVRHANKCYLFDTTPRIWESARDACIHKKSQLVSVETFEEDLFITTSIKSMPESYDLSGYFTSGKEIGLKSWKWTSTGQFMLPYAPWHPTEGAHVDHVNQDCHVYWQTDRFRWHDVECHRSKVGSICEKPL